MATSARSNAMVLGVIFSTFDITNEIGSAGRVCVDPFCATSAGNLPDFAKYLRSQSALRPQLRLIAENHAKNGINHGLWNLAQFAILLARSTTRANRNQKQIKKHFFSDFSSKTESLLGRGGCGTAPVFLFPELSTCELS